MWLGRHWALCVAALLTMSAASHADLLTPREAPGVAVSAIEHSRGLQLFVPRVLTPGDNWATRLLQTMRTRANRRWGGVETMSLGQNARAFIETGSSDDLGDGMPEVGLDIDLDMGDDPGSGLEKMLFADGSEFGSAIVSTGLGIDSLGPDLPPFAVQTGALFATLNRGVLQLALILRRLMGLDSKLQQSPVPDEIIESEVVHTGDKKNESNKGITTVEEPEEPPVSMKQVVRSALKISLGLLLGILLFVAVRNI